MRSDTSSTTGDLSYRLVKFRSSTDATHCLLTTRSPASADQSHLAAAITSPRLPSGRLRPSSTGYGEVGICALFAQISGEGASPQVRTCGKAPSPPTLSPQAGRGSSVAAPNAVAPPASGGGNVDLPRAREMDHLPVNTGVRFSMNARRPSV